MKRLMTLLFSLFLIFSMVALTTPATACPISLDYGDAPDSYGTLSGSNGARHQIGNYFLGYEIDPDSNGQPSILADGDDINGGPDDEDGVVFTSPLAVGKQATVDVIASRAGYLDAWIDFNGDLDWLDAGEQIFSSQPLSSGSNSLFFDVPALPTAEFTYARFRFSSCGSGLSPTGFASDGEVEDYRVSTVPVPGAIWLLGSGLIGLVGLKRKSCTS